jgi:hypothetical protein
MGRFIRIQEPVSAKRGQGCKTIWSGGKRSGASFLLTGLVPADFIHRNVDKFSNHACYWRADLDIRTERFKCALQ